MILLGHVTEHVKLETYPTMCAGHYTEVSIKQIPHGRAKVFSVSGRRGSRISEIT